MDELRGDRASWRFDGESILMRYHTGMLQNAMLKEMVRCEVPIAAVAGADFDLFKSKRKRWAMTLRMRERTDPYAAVGATLTERSQPFRLRGSADTELVAEYTADQIRYAAGQAADAAEPAADLATRLVPPLPLHIQTVEGTAAFDGSTIRLVWTSEATARKKKAHRREIALADVTSAEWLPSDGWEYGHLRINTTEAAQEPVTKPKHDLSCLLCEAGKEGGAALRMAATITAHLWARKA